MYDHLLYSSYQTTYFMWPMYGDFSYRQLTGWVWKVVVLCSWDRHYIRRWGMPALLPATLRPPPSLPALCLLSLKQNLFNSLSGVSEVHQIVRIVVLEALYSRLKTLPVPHAARLQFVYIQSFSFEREDRPCYSGTPPYGHLVFNTATSFSIRDLRPPR